MTLRVAEAAGNNLRNDLKLCFNADMKPDVAGTIMVLVRSVVRGTEKLLNIQISRFPLEKFYGEFIDLANF